MRMGELDVVSEARSRGVGLALVEAVGAPDQLLAALPLGVTERLASVLLLPERSGVALGLAAVLGEGWLVEEVEGLPEEEAEGLCVPVALPVGDGRGALRLALRVPAGLRVPRGPAPEAEVVGLLPPPAPAAGVAVERREAEGLPLARALPLAARGRLAVEVAVGKREGVLRRWGVAVMQGEEVVLAAEAVGRGEGEAGVALGVPLPPAPPAPPAELLMAGLVLGVLDKVRVLVAVALSESPARVGERRAVGVGEAGKEGLPEALPGSCCVALRCEEGVPPPPPRRTSVGLLQGEALPVAARVLDGLCVGVGVRRAGVKVAQAERVGWEVGEARVEGEGAGAVALALGEGLSVPVWDGEASQVGEAVPQLLLVPPPPPPPPPPLLAVAQPLGEAVPPPSGGEEGVALGVAVLPPAAPSAELLAAAVALGEGVGLQGVGVAQAVGARGVRVPVGLGRPVALTEREMVAVCVALASTKTVLREPADRFTGMPRASVLVLMPACQSTAGVMERAWEALHSAEAECESIK